jgi:hypothetical protein
MAQGRFVSYLRVSTDKQGRWGLGLEVQRHLRCMSAGVELRRPSIAARADVISATCSTT